MTWIYDVSRCVLAAVFMLAAISKCLWFDEFVFTITELLGTLHLNFEPQGCALLLIGTEALISSCFLLNWKPREVSLLSLGLLVGFIAVQVILLAEEKSCSCFGALSDEPVSVVDVARNFGLTFLCIIVYRLHNQIKKPKAV